MKLNITSYCHIHQNKVMVNDRLTFFQENFVNFADFIKTLYKQEQVSYPKFYKMDSIGKLGFMAAELALRDKPIAGYKSEAVGLVLANSSSSLDTDIAHNETIKDRSKYFPSPSVFVYTLPNIVIGEICIRHKIKGENAFFISESFDASLLVGYISGLFAGERMEACLCGWVELMGNRFNALMMLVEKSDSYHPSDSLLNPALEFKPEKLNFLMERN
jgi:hypothetical protein